MRLILLWGVGNGVHNIVVGSIGNAEFQLQVSKSREVDFVPSELTEPLNFTHRPLGSLNIPRQITKPPMTG